MFVVDDGGHGIGGGGCGCSVLGGFTGGRNVMQVLVVVAEDYLSIVVVVMSERENKKKGNHAQ